MSKYFGFAGIIFTCEHNHVHVQDDYLYPEVVDNKLVITPLTFEAMPIIRSRLNSQLLLIINILANVVVLLPLYN